MLLNWKKLLPVVTVSENHKEIYSFEDKNNSSDIYVKVAQWENKILEELSEQFNFFILDGKEKMEPYKYGDFKFMKSDLKEKNSHKQTGKSRGCGAGVD